MKNTRLWLLYTPGKHYSFISTFFVANTSVLKEDKNEIKNAVELLAGAGIARKDSLNKMILRNRLLAEYKHTASTGEKATMQWRWRFQNSLVIPLLKIKQQSQLNTVVANELLFKTENNITSFDQDRVSCMLQWHIRNTEYSIGLQETLQEKQQHFLRRNQFLLVMQFYL